MGLSMGTDEESARQDDAYRARRKLKAADAADKQAKFPDTPPAELLRQSQELEAKSVQELRQSGLVEKLLSVLKIATYPTGITVAQFSPTDVGLPSGCRYANQIPGYHALAAFGVTIICNRNAGTFVISNPEKFIHMAEKHGFTLSGELAEKRAEIMAVVEEKGRGGRT